MTGHITFRRRRILPGVNPCLALVRPAAAAAVGVVPFLNASSLRLSFLRMALSEDLDPLDRAAATLWCHTVVEGTVLESSVSWAWLRLFVMFGHGGGLRQFSRVTCRCLEWFGVV